MVTHTAALPPFQTGSFPIYRTGIKGIATNKQEEKRESELLREFLMLSDHLASFELVTRDG